MNKKIGFGVVLLLAVAFTAFAQEYNSESDFKVKKEGNGITITKYAGTATVVNIPPTIQNLPVTSIGNNAFKGTKVTEVTIPDSVTSVGNSALNTASLTSITFQGKISSYMISPFPSFPGDLGRKLLTGGPGTYTRPSGSDTWTNPNSAIAVAPAAAPQNTGTASNQPHADLSGSSQAQGITQNQLQSGLNQAVAIRQQQVADEVAAEQSKTRRSGNDPLEGTTWIQTDGKGYQVLSFHGPLNLSSSNNAPVMILRTGDNISFGTYTGSGDKVTITTDGRDRTGTISGYTITFDAWTFTQYGGPAPAVTAQNSPQSGGNSLEGTWVRNDRGEIYELTFNKGVYEYSRMDKGLLYGEKGTYTANKDTVTLKRTHIDPWRPTRIPADWDEMEEPKESDPIKYTITGSTLTFEGKRYTRK